MKAHGVDVALVDRRSGPISGLNELSIGCGTTALGACGAYLGGLRVLLRD